MVIGSAGFLFSFIPAATWLKSVPQYAVHKFVEGAMIQKLRHCCHQREQLKRIQQRSGMALRRTNVRQPTISGEQLKKTFVAALNCVH